MSINSFVAKILGLSTGFKVLVRTVKIMLKKRVHRYVIFHMETICIVLGPKGLEVVEPPPSPDLSTLPSDLRSQVPRPKT